MKKIIVLISLLLGVLVGLLIFSKSDEKTQSITNATYDTPTPEPKLSETKSIDGKIKLVMQSNLQDDGLVLYAFTVLDEKGERTIFTKTAKPDAFALPQNSWSPSSTFVFIVENDPLTPQVLVFNSSGENFSETEKYINVTTLFQNKQQNYEFVEATGWDSRGLLHIKTKKTDGAKGPNFWFDVDSRSFIQLAR